MNGHKPLPADDLFHACDPARFTFRTTAELEPLEELIGQDRAVEAVEFGIGIRRDGYNLFAAGPAGTGKHTLIGEFLQRQASSEPVPDDWCYVHNFEEPRQPTVLRLPAGRAQPLCASLVFEQSYGGVDGDSASSAELYALMSALAGVAIRQGFAVTGSVNQRGEVQAIGGVNEKIEGFFDVRKARGLTGEQGVLIPASNARHLMLREDVVEACRDGKFAIYAVTSIDQGLEILTGVPAGELDAEGGYPEGSINRLVADRLADFAEKARKMGGAGNGKGGDDEGDGGGKRDAPPKSGGEKADFLS